MNYNISVQEFLKQKGSIDFSDFSAKVQERARQIDKKINCFITIANIDKYERSGSQKPLNSCLPISVKDNICTKSLLTTAGSKILHNYIPPFDATVIERIKQQGWIVGKTTMDEFGFGTFNVNAEKIPKNPFDMERSCGGSSGGSGALTAAADFPHISIAESTGGSISCPASFCGVVGLTPTYGLVSRYGLIDYANSLDKIGVMGKSVWDCAFGLSMIAGHDPKDSTSLSVKQQDYTVHCSNNEKLKIGMPKEYFKNIDKSVEKMVWQAIKNLESEGYRYEEISLPHTDYALAAYYIIAMSEASTNLAKFCGMRYGLSAALQGNFNEYFSEVRSAGFGQEAKRRIILGTYARMAGYREAFYLKALKVRTLVINDFKKAFKKVDVLAAPTMPVLPPKLKDIEKLTPLEHYQSDILTVPVNLAGMPHISVPCGFADDLPVGLHLLADHLQEGKIISLASVYEKLREEVKYPVV